MKKLFLAIAVLMGAVACADKEPVDVMIPKGGMEFTGNGFDTFSLGSDVRLYMSPAQDNADMWVIQAVAPVKKEVAALVSSLSMEMTLLDDKGVRIQDSFLLEAEDIENLVPVFNGSGAGAEKTVVFSVPENGAKKLFTFKQAKAMLSAAKNVRLAINAEIMPEPEPEPEAEEVQEGAKPYTLKWLCERNGVYGLLSKYEKAVRGGDKRKANEIEKQLYSIEKQVKNDKALPENLRKSFLSYVEKRIEDIDARY